jgi:hypothetical protein
LGRRTSGRFNGTGCTGGNPCTKPPRRRLLAQSVILAVFALALSQSSGETGF